MTRRELSPPRTVTEGMEKAKRRHIVGRFRLSTEGAICRYAVSKNKQHPADPADQPGYVTDQLRENLRNGARALLAQTVEPEVENFLGTHAD